MSASIAVEAAPVTRARPRSNRMKYRLVHSRRVIGGSMIVMMAVLFGVLAPVIAPFDPFELDLYALQKPPLYRSAEGNLHLLGTDSVGRDVLSRTIHGARVSLLVSLVVVCLASLVGVSLGVLAAFYGGTLQTVVMRLADVQLAFPGLLLAVAMLAAFGNSLLTLILVLAFGRWVIFARIARAAALAVRESAYIEAARSIGASNGRLLLRHILPNISTPLLVIATQMTGGVMLAESSLTFLGIGVPAEVPTWGNMISLGRRYLEFAPWISIVPGIALSVTVLGIYFLGDGLRDVLDPRLRID